MTKKTSDLKQRLSRKVSEVTQDITFNVEPLASGDDLIIRAEIKIPLKNLTSLNPVFKNLESLLKSVIKNDQEKIGLYRIALPEGLSFSKLKEEGLPLLSETLNEGRSLIESQVFLNPISLNPTMLAVGASLYNIEKKLASIMEAQEELLDFLMQKERSELKGDSAFLNDILNNYKFNWDNEKYKNANYTKVLDIKQAAERKIDFYKERLKAKLNKKNLLQNYKMLEKETEGLIGELKDYQLSLYIYAFSSFLDVLLLGNHDKSYLDTIVTKIEDYSYDYREIYTNAYTEIEARTQSTIENKLIGGLESIYGFAGKNLGKIPAAKKVKIDEKLLSARSKVKRTKTEKHANIIEPLMDRQTSYVRPFIESIREVNLLNNEALELAFDKENIYIASAE